MPFDSNLTQKLVQGACYETSCSYFHSFHKHATRLDRESENIVDLPISEFLIISSAILIACNSTELMEALFGSLICL